MLRRPRRTPRTAMRHGHHDHHADAAATVRDPVCGMTVDPATSKHRFDYRGETYHFCSAGCRTKFAADPVAYLDKDSKPKAAVPEGTIYTCPMHPEIRQVGPGSCPICGMALEPEVASLDAPPNPELADMTRRFWIGLVLALPVVVLEMGGHLVGGHGWVDPTLSNWIQFAFATPVVLWAGWPFFVRGWQSLLTRNLNMFTLIAMGTGVAYVYSVVGTVAPGIFPATFRGHGGAVAVYFEAAAVITVLVLLGQVLELRAREATSGAIKALLQLAPKTARRIGDDGADHEVEIDALAVGDRSARAAGREGAGRRRHPRRPLLARRIAGDRRIDAGHQGGRRQGDRRHAQPVRRLRDARRQGRARHAAVPDRARWWRRRSARARRSSGWPIRLPAGSCRSSSSSR